MKRVELELFEFNELNEDAQKRAVCNYREYSKKNCIDTSDWMFEETLRQFEDILCLDVVRSYQVSDYDYDYSLCQYFAYDMDARDVTGKLLYRFVDTQIRPHMEEGKYYFGRGFHHRYSKVFITHDCPLTGTFSDRAIVDVVMDYCNTWNKKPKDYSLHDFLEDVFDAFFFSWQTDKEWRLSDECLTEELSNQDDCKYMADGSIFDAA